jgi:epoxyqueuosine reductase
MNDKKKLGKLIINKSRELGFSFCGIAKCEALDWHRPLLEKWLEKGYQADMAWMEQNNEKRLDPSLLVNGARSVIVLAYNYYQEYPAANDKSLFSRYALGKDYHKVLKDKIYILLEELRSAAGKVEGRVFVDSAPLLERAWAEKAGLGWIGKNSMLINPREGSWFFLGELVIDLELDYTGERIRDYCGSCTKCIDACPTGAITDSRTLDSSKCISYLTIEKKGNFSDSERTQLNNYVFGCDICQEVCPWNKKAKPTDEKAFSPLSQLLVYKPDDWQKITEDEFSSIFRESPVLRTGYEGFKRNIAAVSELY